MASTNIDWPKQQPLSRHHPITIRNVHLKELPTSRLDKVTTSFVGACISPGHCNTIDDGSDAFIKTNASKCTKVMFDGEHESTQPNLYEHQNRPHA
jgi:hypothetical protein